MDIPYIHTTFDMHICISNQIIFLKDNLYKNHICYSSIQYSLYLAFNGDFTKFNRAYCKKMAENLAYHYKGMSNLIDLVDSLANDIEGMKYAIDKGKIQDISIKLEAGGFKRRRLRHCGTRASLYWVLPLTSCIC